MGAMRVVHSAVQMLVTGLTVRPKGKSFFRFPKDEARCKVWIQNTRREDLIGKTTQKLYNYKLCTDHFEQNQFLYPDKKSKLAWNAVQTLFNVPNPPPKVMQQRQPPKKRSSLLQRNLSSQPKRRRLAQTEPALLAEQNHDLDTNADPNCGPNSDKKPTGPSASSPRKMKMKRQLKIPRNEVYRLKTRMRTTLRSNTVVNHALKTSPNKRKEAMIKELPRYLSGPALHFVTTQLRMAGTPKNARHWTEEDKALALSIIHISPKAYRMQENVFILPSLSTLRRAMTPLQLYPGFNQQILEAHQQKIKTEGKCRSLFNCV